MFKTTSVSLIVCASATAVVPVSEIVAVAESSAAAALPARRALKAGARIRAAAQSHRDGGRVGGLRLRVARLRWWVRRRVRMPLATARR